MSTSKSSPTNTTSTNTTLQTTNENVSGNTGLTNLGGTVNNTSNAFDNSVHVNNTTTTDFGAVAAGTSLSEAALNTVSAANRENASIFAQALNSVGDANQTAADIAARSITAGQSSEQTIADISGNATTAVGNAFGAALTSVQHNTDNTVSVVQNLATQFGASLSDFTAQEQTQLANVVSALNSTYTANNTSANQQVINAVTAAGQQSSDVIKYVALSVVAGAIVFLIFSRK